jgi:hypothetical protein
MGVLTDKQIIELAKQVTGWTTHFASPQEPLGHFYARHHHQASVANILLIARVILAAQDIAGWGNERADKPSANKSEDDECEHQFEPFKPGFCICVKCYQVRAVERDEARAALAAKGTAAQPRKEEP